jgi:alkylhydroperoxidase family enzyme
MSTITTATRLPLVNPTKVSQPVAQALNKLPVINLFLVMANAETLYPPFTDYIAQLFKQLELDAITERMIVLYVAHLSDCFYVWRQNTVVAKSVGVTDEQIAALEKGDITAGCFSTAQRAAFQFTDECVKQIEVSDATYAETAKHLSARQITEILYVLGTYMFICRVVRSGHVPLDAQPAASPA